MSAGAQLARYGRAGKSAAVDDSVKKTVPLSTKNQEDEAAANCAPPEHATTTVTETSLNKTPAYDIAALEIPMDDTMANEDGGRNQNSVPST